MLGRDILLRSVSRASRFAFILSSRLNYLHEILIGCEFFLKVGRLTSYDLILSIRPLSKKSSVLAAVFQTTNRACVTTEGCEATADDMCLLRALSATRISVVSKSLVCHSQLPARNSAETSFRSPMELQTSLSGFLPQNYRNEQLDHPSLSAAVPNDKSAHGCAGNSHKAEDIFVAPLSWSRVKPLPACGVRTAATVTEDRSACATLSQESACAAPWHSTPAVTSTDENHAGQIKSAQPSECLALELAKRTALAPLEAARPLKLRRVTLRSPPPSRPPLLSAK